MNSEIAALILFFEKPQQTIECLKSLLPYNIEIYVLNNGSSTEARKEVGDFCAGIPHIHIIDSEVNLGVAGGRNRLIRESTQEWLFFLDNDMIAATPDLISIFKKHAEENPDADVLVGYWHEVHTDEPGLAIKFTYTEEYLGRQRTRFEHMPGGVTFMKRSLFDAIGFLNDDLHVGYEDFEFINRAKEKNYTIVAVLMEDVLFLHDHRHMERREDRAAVEHRYSLDIFKKSYQIMHDKYGWVVKNPGGGLEFEKDRMLNTPELSCPASPVAASLYMTSRCNFKCSWCYRNIFASSGEDSYLALDTVKALLQRYPGLKHATLAGQGEPTFSPEFKDIVRYLHGQNKDLLIISNGSNPQPILDVKDCVKRVSLSLYGSSNDKYFQYCGVRAFDDVINGYHAMRERNIKVELTYIVDKHDLGELENVLSLCDILDPGMLILLNPLWYDLRNTAFRDNIITQDDSEIIEKINLLCKKRKYPVRFPTYPDFHNPVRLCRSYFDTISIDSKGNISGCRRQYTPASEFGNIFEHEDCFNTYTMMRLRRSQIMKFPAHPECVYCFGNWQTE